MISKQKELLAFIKPVKYESDDISGTLSNVEISM
jgi:hypothetical protein